MSKNNYKKEKEYFQNVAICFILAFVFTFATLFCSAKIIYAESYTYNDKNRYHFETSLEQININETIYNIENNYPIKIIIENTDEETVKQFVSSLNEALEWYGVDTINKIAENDIDKTLEFTLQSYKENMAYINDNGQYGALIDKPATRVFVHEIFHIIDALVEYNKIAIFDENIYLNEYCATSAQEDKAVSYEYYYLMMKGITKEPGNNILKQKIITAKEIVEIFKK